MSPADLVCDAKWPRPMPLEQPQKVSFDNALQASLVDQQRVLLSQQYAALVSQTQTGTLAGHEHFQHLGSGLVIPNRNIANALYY